jgi:hypothetical protein
MMIAPAKPDQAGAAALEVDDRLRRGVGALLCVLRLVRRIGALDLTLEFFGWDVRDTNSGLDLPFRRFSLSCLPPCGY